jgi:hypothetical protein
MSQKPKLYDISFVITVASKQPPIVSMMNSTNIVKNQLPIIVKTGDTTILGKSAKDAIRLLNGEIQTIILTEFASMVEHCNIYFYYHFEMESKVCQKN